MRASQRKTPSCAEHFELVFPGKGHQSHVVGLGALANVDLSLNLAAALAYMQPAHGSSLIQIESGKVTLRNQNRQLIEIRLNRLTQQLQGFKDGFAQASQRLPRN